MSDEHVWCEARERDLQTRVARLLSERDALREELDERPVPEAFAAKIRDLQERVEAAKKWKAEAVRLREALRGQNAGDTPTPPASSMFGDPEYVRCKLLPVYTALLMERAKQGIFDDLRVEVSEREYLQIMYETHIYRGVAAGGGRLVWAPWPTDPEQDLPVTVEIRLPGGRIVFACPERKPRAAPPKDP